VKYVTQCTQDPTGAPIVSPVHPFDFPKLVQVADDGKWKNNDQGIARGTLIYPNNLLGLCQGDCDGDDESEVRMYQLVYSQSEQIISQARLCDHQNISKIFHNKSHAPPYVE